MRSGAGHGRRHFETEVSLEVLERLESVDFVTSWRKEGREEGRQEGEMSIVLRLLNRRIGQLSPNFILIRYTVLTILKFLTF